MPEICDHARTQHTLSDANLEDLHTQSGHEALQKLAIFFQHNRNGCGDITNGGDQTPTNAEQPSFLSGVEEPAYPDQEVDLGDVEMLPPPPLYADTF